MTVKQYESSQESSYDSSWSSIASGIIVLYFEVTVLEQVDIILRYISLQKMKITKKVQPPNLGNFLRKRYGTTLYISCTTTLVQSIPYHTILCYTIPYVPYHTFHTIPYHTIPYHTIPYHTIPYHTIPYHTIPYHTIPYHTIPYHTIPYHTIPYHI